MTAARQLAAALARRAAGPRAALATRGGGGGPVALNKPATQKVGACVGFDCCMRVACACVGGGGGSGGARRQTGAPARHEIARPSPAQAASLAPPLTAAVGHVRARLRVARVACELSREAPRHTPRHPPHHPFPPYPTSLPQLAPEDELNWDDGTANPEYCVDRWDDVGKYQALRWLAGGFAVFGGALALTSASDKRSRIPFAPRDYPADVVALVGEKGVGPRD